MPALSLWCRHLKNICLSSSSSKVDIPHSLLSHALGTLEEPLVALVCHRHYLTFFASLNIRRKPIRWMREILPWTYGNENAILTKVSSLLLRKLPVGQLTVRPVLIMSSAIHFRFRELVIYVEGTQGSVSENMTCRPGTVRGRMGCGIEPRSEKG